MLASSLRVTIAESDAATAYKLAKDLRTLGHEPLHVVKTAGELIERAAVDKPDLIVADVRLAVGDGVEAVEAVYQKRPVPIIVASSEHDTELVSRVEVGPAIAFLVKPVELADLKSAVALAARRFAYCRTLEKEVETLRQSLEERKLLERAKGIVQRMLRIEEEDAHRRIRKYASDCNVKVIDVARKIIDAEEPFRELSRLGSA